jgi:hypothetical protein
MLIAFFDELATDPRALLKRVLDFLGVDSSDRVIPESVGTNQNPGRGSSVPPELRSYLAELHFDQIHRLHAELNNFWTKSWLASTDADRLAAVSPQESPLISTQGMAKC